MKLSEMLEEGSVASIDAFKQKQKTKEKQNIQRAKENAMADIDHAVARTIDILANELGPLGAQTAVMSHLSDLVMAFDMQGGMYD